MLADTVVSSLSLSCFFTETVGKNWGIVPGASGTSEWSDGAVVNPTLLKNKA